MRLVVAEGSAILRAGLAHVLEAQGHQLAPPVHDARMLPALVDVHRPDVLIVNARLAPAAGDAGVAAAVQVRRQYPDVGVLLFSASAEPGHLARLFAGEGAGLGYLLQDRMTDCESLLDALGRVAAGGTVVDPRMVRALAAATAHEHREGHEGHGGRGGGLEALSERESQVLALMAQGRTNSAIAQRLVVSQGTVEKRLAAVFDKLGIAAGPGDNRRVLAVLRYLSAGKAPAAVPGARQPTPYRLPSAA
ncbi:response regulator transcription factor [Streptomyces resistomycificus]|uniref:LuxR family transcriptional regulator n=2 Tax=Streptomyces resistomycificus TaxID=67356 RepID=A0A0L8L376_9ACTN|nr:response regulator transcription factor [Streptomyces resistomycificus]KOG32617.1 LuxR family transcriptional regulator [Streptomyces resistomycificus]KUN90556.1 LuxR family transcriptional regulator [Streptomyces resistomycificus]